MKTLLFIEQKRFLKYLQWCATACLFFGALIISVVPLAGSQLSIFYLFALGHVLFIIDCFFSKMLPYLVLNFGFLALDVAAIFIRL